jgi:hypothetical protein
MPDTDRQELIDQLIRETGGRASGRPEIPVLVAAALLAASSPDLLAEATQAATTTADRQFVAIAVAHLAGEHGRVEALARDHLIDHPSRPVLAWIVARSRTSTHDQGVHR